MHYIQEFLRADPDGPVREVSFSFFSQLFEWRAMVRLGTLRIIAFHTDFDYLLRILREKTIPEIIDTHERGERYGD